MQSARAACLGLAMSFVAGGASDAPCVAAEPPGAAASVPVTTIDAFVEEARSALPAEMASDEKLWRQIAPSVFWLLHDHPQADREAALPELVATVDTIRERSRPRVVMGPDVAVLALLDPDRGLDPKQVTTLALAYGTQATVFKQDDTQTRATVADAFLTQVGERASGGQPATVIVLGHGLPREIQSYGIPVDKLAEALLPTKGSARDLSHLTLIFDDCYSADFCLNLAAALRDRAGDNESASPLRAPTMVAGTSRCRVGHADVRGKFVPHFWAEVIELLYIRTPRPKTITLDDFLGRVDNAMYGYGRDPVFVFGKHQGYRLVDPEMVQDPVIFVPLTDADREALAKPLGVEDPASLGLVLDVG